MAGFLALAAMLLFTLPAYAGGIIEEKAGTFTFSYEGVGAAFSLYRVAGMSMDTAGNLTFPLTDAFAASGVKLTDTSAEAWDTAATTLEGFAESKSIKADYTVTIDANGKGSIQNLPVGLYLIGGTNVTYKNTLYTANASLVTLPGSSDKIVTNQTKWEYDRQVDPKGKKEDVTKPETKKKAYRVRKVWKNDAKSDRPKEIKVKITCTIGDKKTSETQTLNSGNNWSYAWTTENVNAKYTVEEVDVPSAYNRSIKSTAVKLKDNTQETLFTITNTKKTPKGGSKKPPKSTPSGSSRSSGGYGTTGSKSVKTGDTTNLRLPIILLIASGCVILLILGRTLKNRRHV